MFFHKRRLRLREMKSLTSGKNLGWNLGLLIVLGRAGGQGEVLYWERRGLYWNLQNPSFFFPVWLSDLGNSRLISDIMSVLGDS
jgi:hypothetical protein